MSVSSSRVELVCASQQSVFLAGESGPVWRVVEGIVRIDRQNGTLRQPVQLALPGDLIGPLLFLACDDSAFMTGETVVVDGGSVMH